MLPLVLLATVATIIASQAIITGAFSMTRQAIRLGWMQRLRITQTSQEGYGQIYVGAVNWLLMAVTIGLTLVFKKSDSLASAYGIAVSATMLMTTGLLFIAMREIWNWSWPRAAAIAGLFLIVDAAFLGANLVKIADGGYIPIAIAALVYAAMYVWHRGTDALRQHTAGTLPLEQFFAGLPARGIVRVKGTAVFLTRSKDATPPVLAWYVKRAQALHEKLVLVTIETEPIPWVDVAKCATLIQVAPDVWRLIAHYGFMERPDILRLLRRVKGLEVVDLSLAT